MSADHSQSEIFAFMRPKRVCTCRNVDEARLQEAIDSGARNFDEVQKATRVSTGCGSCRTKAEQLVDEMIARKLEQEQS